MNTGKEQEKLSDREFARLIIDFFRRTALHYGIWFNEVSYQLGLEEALKTEAKVFERLYPIFMKRLSSTLGFELEDGLPSSLSLLPREQLDALADSIAANWLAADGIWFQTVEQRQEMFTAKRCNDTCWTKFSPVEAYGIKQLLHLPEAGGIDALEAAIVYRFYSRINTQRLERQDGALIYKMEDCRVQRARKIKGLEDYPCKSAGIVEYSSFASTIDSRIKTECIACPPDNHPAEWTCAWKFYMK